MKTLDVSSQFYLSLLEFMMGAKHHMAAISAEFGLTGLQAITLLLTDQNAPRTMKSFCTLYNCDASNITGIMDGLEQKGLVLRQNHATDRRIKIVCLEPAGKELQRAIIHRLAEVNSFLFDTLSEAEARQFITIVKKLTAKAAGSNFC